MGGGGLERRRLICLEQELRLGWAGRITVLPQAAHGFEYVEGDGEKERHDLSS